MNFPRKGILQSSSWRILAWLTICLKPGGQGNQVSLFIMQTSILSEFIVMFYFWPLIYLTRFPVLCFKHPRNKLPIFYWSADGALNSWCDKGERTRVSNFLFWRYLTNSSFSASPFQSHFKKSLDSNAESSWGFVTWILIRFSPLLTIYT